MKKPTARIQKSNALIYCRVSTEEQVENLSLGTKRQRQSPSARRMAGW